MQSFKIIDRMKIYTKYCNNYPAAEKLYKDKIKKREFEAFINVSYQEAFVVTCDNTVYLF